MSARSQPLAHPARPIVIVDDDEDVQRTFANMLCAAGLTHVETLADERELLPFLDAHPSAMVLLDLSMPHIGGEDLLGALVERHPEVPVVVATGTMDIDTAVRCIRQGAFDYVVKPLDRERLVTTVRRALEVGNLRTEVDRLRERVLAGRPEQPALFRHVITEDPAMLAIFNYIEAVARSPQPILIYGETGTGKELIAGAIHECAHVDGPLVPVNVAGLDDTLFSDTLFGHERGAYTTADKAREGLVAKAANGTLFLDEIGDLTAESQVKLLRLLQNRTYYSIGSDREKRSSARIVVATNRDLEERMANGLFRSDLYYRLRTHTIRLPPLRTRRGDIAPLARHFLEQACASLHKTPVTLSSTALQWLQQHDFPGNIRELEAMIYDAAAVASGAVLEASDFNLPDAVPPPPQPPLSGAATALGLDAGDALPTLKAAEGQLIEEALRRAGGNQRRAADLLGITRQALNKRLSRRNA